MRICKTRILFDNAQTQQFAITADSPLTIDANGLTTVEMADVKLSLDAHDELVILKNSPKNIELERAGRHITLRPERPVRLCEKDIIHIESARLIIERSTFATPASTARKALTVSKRILAASAALCTLTTLSACDDESCNNGDTKCKDNAVYECKDNSWTLKEKCEGELDPECRVYDNEAECVPTRTSGVAIPPDICENGSMKCEENAVYECKDGDWELLQNCGRDTCSMTSDNQAECVSLTESGVMAYECEAGASKCDDNAVYDCKNGLWSLKEKCDELSECIEENSAASCVMTRTSGEEPLWQCESGESKCENDSVYVCDNGVWKQKEQCADDYECVSTDNGAACVEARLSGEPLPPECEDDQTKCDQNSVYECKGGLWALKEKCSSLSECVTTNNGAMCVASRTSGIMPEPEPDPVPIKFPEK